MDGLVGESGNLRKKELPNSFVFERFLVEYESGRFHFLQVRIFVLDDGGVIDPIKSRKGTEDYLCRIAPGRKYVDLNPAAIAGGVFVCFLLCIAS